MLRPFIAFSVVALLIGLVAGCGEKRPTRYGVSGSVTYQGKPVPFGAIQFTPDVSKGNTGPSAFAGIRDGKYDSDADGRGTIGGPHVISVDAFDGQQIDPEFFPNGRPLGQGFRKPFDLPKGEDTMLDIELSE